MIAAEKMKQNSHEEQTDINTRVNAHNHINLVLGFLVGTLGDTPSRILTRGDGGGRGGLKRRKGL